jgi:hypothetical protein
MTPETIAAMGADYRASFHADREHDLDDRAAGRRIAAPVLVVIGEDEAQLADARRSGGAWADDLNAIRIPAGISRAGRRRRRQSLAARFWPFSAGSSSQRKLLQFPTTDDRTADFDAFVDADPRAWRR